jgi:hypothetical protein
VINTLLMKSHIVLIIDDISPQQMIELSDCLNHLIQKPHVALVKLQHVFPDRFYQSPEIVKTEKQAMRDAKEALSWTEQVLGFSTVHHVIPRPHFATWMRRWKQERDTLVIGKKKVFQTNRFFKRTAFVVDIDSWLAAFEQAV